MSGKRRQAPQPRSFLRNLAAGDLGPLERLRAIAGNLARKARSPSMGCCGNYGEPGC